MQYLVTVQNHMIDLLYCFDIDRGFGDKEEGNYRNSVALRAKMNSISLFAIAILLAGVCYGQVRYVKTSSCLFCFSYFLLMRTLLIYS